MNKRCAILEKYPDAIWNSAENQTKEPTSMMVFWRLFSSTVLQCTNLQPLVWIQHQPPPNLNHHIVVLLTSSPKPEASNQHFLYHCTLTGFSLSPSFISSPSPHLQPWIQTRLQELIPVVLTANPLFIFSSLCTLKTIFSIDPCHHGSSWEYRVQEMLFIRPWIVDCIFSFTNNILPDLVWKQSRLRRRRHVVSSGGMIKNSWRWLRLCWSKEMMPHRLYGLIRSW